MNPIAFRVGLAISVSAAVAIIAAPTTRAEEELSTGEAAALMAEIGLTPESLAIAGVSIEEAEEMVARMQAAESLRIQYVAARNGLQDDSGTVTALRERRFHAVEGVSAANVATSLGSMAASQSNVTTIANYLFVLQTGDLGEAKQALLSACRQGPSSGLPAEFWPLGLSASEATELRVALVAEQRADRLGEELANQQADLLEAYREDQRVQDASEALQSVDTLRQALQ